MEKMKGPVPSEAGSGKVFENAEGCTTTDLSPRGVRNRIDYNEGIRQLGQVFNEDLHPNTDQDEASQDLDLVLKKVANLIADEYTQEG